MRTLFVLGLSLAAVTAVAETKNWDQDAQKEALEKTQKMLADPAARAKEGKSPEAKAAMKQLEQLGGNAANNQKLYEFAGDVLETLVKITGGDPQKMMELLQAAQKNPELLGDKLTPKQKEKLRELARDIEASKVP